MNRQVNLWLERGLLQTVAYRLPGRLDEEGLRQFVSLLPVVSSLARLWGSYAPARASGAVSSLRQPPLRGAARAAAMEFAPWPSRAVQGTLRRAERDSAHAAWLDRLPDSVLLDAWDELALAWARHLPAELPAVHARLHARLRPEQDPHLWARSIESRAVHRELLPPLPPEELAALPRWQRLARWGTTPAQRAQACLVLAVAAWPRAEG